MKDDFKGTTKVLPNNSTLTVLDCNGLKGNKKKYKIHCSVCSLDEELHPEGSIEITKSNWQMGYIPCGCADIPKWTERQNKIRVQRLCKEEGYIFKGWEGQYKGNTTKLSLENPTTGNLWHTGTIAGLLSGTRDPAVKKLKVGASRSKPHSFHINNFIVAGFDEETYSFTKSGRKDSRGFKSFWKYTCTLCSNDKYVKAKACSGVFEATVGSLKDGVKSCRCSKTYRWTAEQRKVELNSVCQEEGLIFEGFEDNFTGNSTKIKWVCKEGHKNSTTISNFLHHSSRCATCFKRESGVNGFFSERITEKDYLYILCFNGQFIKVGRSFDIQRRIKDLQRLSGIVKVRLLKSFTGTHEEVYEAEQWIHQELEDRGFYHNESEWSTETFTNDSIGLVDYLVRQTILTEV